MCYLVGFSQGPLYFVSFFLFLFLFFHFRFCLPPTTRRSQASGKRKRLSFVDASAVVLGCRMSSCERRKNSKPSRRSRVSKEPRKRKQKTSVEVQVCFSSPVASFGQARHPKLYKMEPRPYILFDRCSFFSCHRLLCFLAFCLWRSFLFFSCTPSPSVKSCSSSDHASDIVLKGCTLHEQGAYKNSFPHLHAGLKFDDAQRKQGFDVFSSVRYIGSWLVGFAIKRDCSFGLNIRSTV